MATFNFNCPQCGYPLISEEEWQGLESECPSCHKIIIIPVSSPPSFLSKILPEYLKNKINLFITCIFVFLFVVLTVLCFVLQNKPEFLLEEMTGVTIGQRVCNKNPDGNSTFSDCFHCFDISEQYKGKILFEKVSFPASLSDVYIGDGTAVISSPAAITDSDNKVRFLSVMITNKKLFSDMIQDFSNKGFGRGINLTGANIHITDLLHCDFKQNRVCLFTSENNQYKLYIEIGKHPGLLNYKEEVYGAMVILCGKIPKDSQKGLRLLMNTDGFLDPGMINGSQKSSIYAHSAIHYDGKSSNCTHVDGMYE